MKEGWEYKKLGEVGQIITGATPSTKDKDNYSSKDYCFIKPSDIEAEGISNLHNSEFYISNKAFQNSRKLPVGSVLTTCIGIIGKVGILKINATCNQQINAIIPKNIITSKFLAYAIKGSGTYLSQIANAPIVPIINKKAFSEVNIPVPPLVEQKRIVEELDLLSGIIEKQKQQLKELDTLAQSIFYDMFGDPVTNEKGWKVKSLESICKLGAGGDKPSDITKLPTENNKIPVYSNGIENEGLYGFTSIPRIDKPSLTISGRGTIGVPFIRKKPFVPIVRLIVATPIMELNIIFLYFLIKELKLGGNGGAIPQLTVPMVRNLSCLFPPIALQNLFASKIEAIEKQKEAIIKSIDETQKLFDYTMDKYFG